MAPDPDEKRDLRQRIRQKNERLKTARQKIVEKDREIELLRTEVARTRGSSGLAGPEEPHASVFFLVGRAKSGTSWLMRTLNAHPEILCRGEGRIFGREYKSEEIKNMQSRTIQPSSLYRAILDAEYLNAWVERSVWTRDGDKEEHLAGLTGVAADYFLTKKLAGTGKKIVGDKTPLLGDHMVREIGEMCPGARVIHIVRDGRDVAVSSMHHTWNHVKQEGGTFDLQSEQVDKRDRYRADPASFLASGESIFSKGQLASIAEDWAGLVQRAAQDGARLFGERYTEVRYEDLLERPEDEVGCVLDFLGADAGARTVQRCVESASFEKWAGDREQGQEDSTAFLRKGVAGDWQNVFNKEDRRVFKETAGTLLIELGYERDDDW